MMAAPSDEPPLPPRAGERRAPIGSALSDCQRPAREAGAVDLTAIVTVILNTSPVRAHPSTRLIEEVVESFAWAPGLLACRLIVVADGYKLRGRNEHKSGIVSPDVAASYERYISRVDALTSTPGSALAGAELLVLTERHGCAHAFRRGLARVTTPLVLVVQHDRPFCAPVDLAPLVRVLEGRAGEVNYVGLVTATTRDYEWCWESRGIPAAFFRSRTLVAGPTRLIPLVALLDSTHLASAAWLRSRVFGPEMRTSLPPGCFLEDTLGQAQLAELRTDPSSHAWYGTFLASQGPGAPTLVAHLNGRDGLAETAGWRKWRLADRHTPDADWEAWEASTKASDDAGAGDERCVSTKVAGDGGASSDGASMHGTPPQTTDEGLGQRLASRLRSPRSLVLCGFYDSDGGTERRTWQWSLPRHLAAGSAQPVAAAPAAAPPPQAHDSRTAPTEVVARSCLCASASDASESSPGFCTCTSLAGSESESRGFDAQPQAEAASGMHDERTGIASSSTTT